MTKEEMQNTSASLWHLIRIAWLLAYFLLNRHEKTDFNHSLAEEFDFDYTLL